MAKEAYAKHPRIYTSIAIASTVAKLGASGYIGYRLWDKHKKAKQARNTINGLHPGNGGYGTAIVQAQTDFGSGWDAEWALAKAAQAVRRKAAGAGFRPMHFPRIQRPASRILYGKELATQDFGAARWNIIEGLHPGGGNGLGKATLQDMTDFGSPVDIAKAVWRAASTFGKAEEPRMIISMPEFKMTEESGRAAIRKIISKENALQMHVPGIHVDMTGYQVPEFMQKRIKENLMKRPTVGLVTNVLGDPRFNQGHKAFAGKSY